MDARTRERLPVLPVLVRSAARQHADAPLCAARGAGPGETISAAGTTLAAPHKTRADGVWAGDPATGKRRNLALEEDRAFWAWAIVEVLRATGVRLEELRAQPSQPGAIPAAHTGELVPLLQIVPSKTDNERLLVVSPELADVLSAIISRVRGTAAPCRSSPPTTSTSGCGCPGPCCSSAASTPRTGQSPSPHAQDARRRPGPNRLPARPASPCATPRTTSAGYSSPTPS